MPFRVKKSLLLMVAACFWPGFQREVAAQEVVAVLSSELGPYLEAYEGFKEAMGHPVPVVSLSAGEPKVGRKTRIVEAFGSKAALEKYPADAVLIYCMAPGTKLEAGGRKGVTIGISMLPRAREVIAAVRQIQPMLNRLAVFWVLDTTEDYLQQMKAAAAELQIEILDEQLQDADDLPDRLRALMNKKADALWLPPDPLLINAQSFSVIKEFSWANDVPFYAPTAGFVEAGAVASVAVSFKRVGLTVAQVVQQVLSGETMPDGIYPEESETTLNLTAAAQTGLQISAEVKRRVHKVVP